MSEKSTVDDLGAGLRVSAVLDSPEIYAAVQSIFKAELARRDGLSPTQERRAIARAQGKSIREIAEAEGRAPSTIAESLAAPTVRARIAAELRLMYVNQKPVLRAVLEQLVTIALGAEKPGGPYGDRWPDYRTRLDACMKLLNYYDAPDGSERGSSPPAFEQEAVERSITATERRVTTRTKPGRKGQQTPKPLAPAVPLP